MVPVRDLIIMMTAPTRFFGAVRDLTFKGKGGPIVSLQGDLFMERILRCDWSRIEGREEQSGANNRKAQFNLFQGNLLLIRSRFRKGSPPAVSW